MDLQQHVSEFAEVLTHPSKEKMASFVRGIKQSSTIPNQLAVDIYRNNTRGSKMNTMAHVYPACKNILGDDTFNAVVKVFVDIDNTGVSDLNFYGKEFYQYLNSIIKAGRLSVEYEYLPDLARLEYQVHAAYYADEDLAFDFTLFDNRIRNEQTIYFQVSASLAVFVFYSPIDEIWRNNHKNINFSESSVQAITEAQYLLVHRIKYIPIVQKITKVEYQLLDAFINNYSLDFVIDAFDSNMTTILPELIAKKWLVGIK